MRRCGTCAAALQRPQSLGQVLKAVKVLVVLTVQQNLLGVRKQTRNSAKRTRRDVTTPFSTNEQQSLADSLYFLTAAPQVKRSVVSEPTWSR